MPYFWVMHFIAWSQKNVDTRYRPRPYNKVEIFWEVYKNLKKNPSFLTLLSMYSVCQRNWEILFQFCVAFSQYLNLKDLRATETCPTNCDSNNAAEEEKIVCGSDGNSYK